MHTPSRMNMPLNKFFADIAKAHASNKQRATVPENTVAKEPVLAAAKAAEAVAESMTATNLGNLLKARLIAKAQAGQA